jgi:uncharacterized membrane protein YfcA
MLTLHPKTASAGIGGSVALIVLWVMSYWVDVPPEIAAAATLIIATFCAWLAPWLPKAKPAEAAGGK